ncbi:MAG TPA: hypothetical protein PKC28_14085 [Bdellovibrionales bacterium]|nr:hypothetical protein [Bdellovibrionales bacterium]
MSFWLCLEWPGIFNRDSHSDLNRAIAGQVHYWRSYLYNAYLRGLVSISGEPALITIVQCVIVAVIFSALAVRLHKRAPRATPWSMAILLLCPLNGLFAVHVNRDTLMAWLCAWAAVELFLILKSIRLEWSGILRCTALATTCAALRGENLVLPLMLLFILGWHYRHKPAVTVRIAGVIMVTLSFFFFILPPLVGAETKQILPYAANREGQEYRAEFIMSPLRQVILSLPLAEREKAISPEFLHNIFKPQDLLAVGSPLRAFLLMSRANSEASIEDWVMFRKNAHQLLALHPWTVLKNRVEMFKANVGFSSETYYLHDFRPKDSVWPAARNWLRAGLEPDQPWRMLYASLLLPFAMLGFVFLNWKRYPAAACAATFGICRLIPLFLASPAPHFSYVYSVFLLELISKLDFSS